MPFQTVSDYATLDDRDVLPLGLVEIKNRGLISIELQFNQSFLDYCKISTASEWLMNYDLFHEVLISTHSINGRFLSTNFRRVLFIKGIEVHGPCPKIEDLSLDFDLLSIIS